MTFRSILAASAAIATLSFAGPALATITIVMGNVPGALDTILLDKNDDGTDNQLLGKSNAGWTVLIEGEENIDATTTGQAWVVGTDGGLQFLRISTPGATFTGLELNINEPDGTTGPPQTWDIILHGYDQLGNTFTSSFGDITNNQFFNWVAGDGQVITAVDFRTDGDVSMGQLRIGGIAAVVPEPATWAMMIIGFGGVGAMMRRRRGHLAFAA
jgi:hypothetical protein